MPKLKCSKGHIFWSYSRQPECPICKRKREGSNTENDNYSARTMFIDDGITIADDVKNEPHFEGGGGGFGGGGSSGDY